MKAFSAPPIDQNAAPLYLDALWEFSPELRRCFPEGPELRRRDPEYQHPTPKQVDQLVRCR